MHLYVAYDKTISTPLEVTRLSTSNEKSACLITRKKVTSVFLFALRVSTYIIFIYVGGWVIFSKVDFVDWSIEIFFFFAFFVLMPGSEKI